MVRTVLVCTDLYNARIVSAEPLSYDERSFDEIRTIIAGDPVYYGVLDKMFNKDEFEVAGQDLTRAVREFLSILRAKVNDHTLSVIYGLLDDCTWAIEKDKALCIWVEGGGANVPYDDE